MCKKHNGWDYCRTAIPLLNIGKVDEYHRCRVFVARRQTSHSSGSHQRVSVNIGKVLKKVKWSNREMPEEEDDFQWSCPKCEIQERGKRWVPSLFAKESGIARCADGGKHEWFDSRLSKRRKIDGCDFEWDIGGVFTTECGHSITTKRVKKLGGPHEGKWMSRITGPAVEKSELKHKSLFSAPELMATKEKVVKWLTLSGVKELKTTLRDSHNHILEVLENEDFDHYFLRTEMEKKIWNIAHKRGIAGVSASDSELQEILGVGRARLSQILGSIGPDDRKLLKRRKVGTRSEYYIKRSGMDCNLEKGISFEREFRLYADYFESPKEVELTRFDPALTFVSGPTTTNLIMSFFQSNPDLHFSRDDAFVHINRHCEEIELGNYFRASKEDGGMGYEFECKDECPLEKEILMIGRSSILRVVKNLEKTHILEKNEDGGHTRYGWTKNSMTESLNQIATITRNQDDYRRFTDEWRPIRERSRNHIQEVVKNADRDMGEVVSNYLEDLLNNWKREDRQKFSSKMARLSYYCQIYGVSYSTANREWKREWKHKFKGEIMRRSENEEEYQKLVKLCVGLGDGSLTPVKASRTCQILDSFQKIGIY